MKPDGFIILYASFKALTGSSTKQMQHLEKIASLLPQSIRDLPATTGVYPTIGA
jgi:hypothetical protein